MIADMLRDKKPNPVVTGLFIKRRKYLSCFFYTILFRCSEKYQTKFNKLFVIKIPNKREPQQIAFNHT